MQPKILLIEDNPADAALIGIYLEEAAFGQVVSLADSLGKGFELLKKNAIDIVLLDLSLTDSSGFGTLEKFLGEFPHIPVIVLTGLNNDIVGVRCVRAGAQDFLVKGEFDSRTLGKSIRHSMQRFQTQTKLKESAQKLSIQQKRIQEAQELARFANWEMDMVTNAMKWADEMHRIFGIQSHAAPLSLSDYLNYVYFDDRDKVEAFFTEAVRDGEMHKMEHRIVVGNRVKFLSVRAKVHFDDAANSLLLIGSAQDISDQAPFLPGAAAQPAPWDQSQGAFLSGLAGQVHKPLFDVLGLAHLLQKTANPTQKELIAEFRTDMEELLLSVDNLLCAQTVLTGRIALEPRPFSPSVFFQNFAEIAEVKALRAGTGFHLYIEPGMPAVVSADERKIAQVFFNLLKCAMMGHPHPHIFNIKLSVSTTDAERHALRFTLIPGVREMPADLLHSTLESADISFLSDPQIKTKVIDLAVCGYLIRALNGRFAISAENDMCSALDVWIPVKVVKPAPDEAHALLNQLQILLVDNHPLHRIAGRSVLAGLAEGAGIVLAENIQEAKSQLAQRKFDLVLLDTKLNESDGSAIPAMLRKHAGTPFIAVSPSPTEEEREHCMTNGFRAYIGKPLDADSLREIIRELRPTA